MLWGLIYYSPSSLEGTYLFKVFILIIRLKRETTSRNLFLPFYIFNASLLLTGEMQLFSIFLHINPLC